MNVRHAAALLFAFAPFVGCSASPQAAFDDEKTSTAVAALDVGTSSTELDDIVSSVPAQAASDLAIMKTRGCRTRSVDPANPNVVHVVLDACSGRFDRHVVSGNLTVTFSSNPDGSLHAESVSSDLTIDGRPFTRTVSADIAITGHVLQVSRHSEKTGTKADGDSFVYTGDHVVVTDTATACRTVNGVGHSVVAGTRNIESTTTDFRTCETPDGDDFCPTGTIDHVNAATGKTVHEAFDGSATATIDITKPKGDKTELWTIHCSPSGGSSP